MKYNMEKIVMDFSRGGKNAKAERKMSAELCGSLPDAPAL